MKSQLESLILALMAVFLPIKPVLLTAMALNMVDLVTGVWAAHKRGEAITSNGFRRTFVKVFVYQVAVMCGFLVQKHLIQDSIPIVNLVGGLIGITEMKSILENLDTISGESMFKVLIDKLGSQSNKVDKK